MKPITFRAWLIGSVFTSCTMVLMAPAVAQTSSTTTASAPTQGLSTITVVARKKKEDLQKVPLSVTAITAHTLKQAHVENFHEIAALTPGLTVTDTGSEANTTVTIRGQADLTEGGNVPNVATFLDFTYLRDPAAINVAAIPLQQVEVIQGPVSALYGKDAYTGVVNYIAARPTTTPHGDISETAGDYGKSELQGDISGPIFGDKVLGELFGDFDTFNGTFHDKVSGADAGGELKKDFGGLLDINWTANISTHIDAYYGYDYFNAAPFEQVQANCGPGFVPSASGTFVQQNTIFCGRVHTNGQVQTGNNPESKNPGNERRVFYASVNNTGSFDWGTINAITGASQITSEAFQQFEATSLGEPFLLANALTPGTPNGNAVLAHEYFGDIFNTKEFSQELRYSSPQNRSFRYGAGGFFDSETRITQLGIGINSNGVPAGQVIDDFGLSQFVTPTGHPNVFTQNIQVSDEEAAFANAEYDILPNLTASAEYRYTWLLQTFTPQYNVFFPGVYLGGGGHIAAAEQYFSTNEALRWFPIPNQMLYVAFGNGVKPGGFNGTETVKADEAFGPETDKSYEGGFKTNLLGDTLQFDATAYHVDSTNVQAYGPSSDPKNTGLVIRNLAATNNNGVEALIRARPADGLILTGGFNYNHPVFNNGSLDQIDAGYCKTIGPGCTNREVTLPNGNKAIPISGYNVPYSPNYTLSATAEYDYLLFNKYPAYVRGDYSFRAAQYNDPARLTSLGSYSDLDFFAGVSRGPYTLSAYVKNITNETTPDNEALNVQLSAFQDDPVATLQQGRTFAFTIAGHF